jgi:hypothetical protein
MIHGNSRHMGIQFGNMHSDGINFKMNAFVCRRTVYGPDTHFRLLLKDYQLKFYVNDLFVHCNSIPVKATRKIDIIHEVDPVIFQELNAWDQDG